MAESDELKRELARLQDALEAFRANESAITEQLSATESQLRQALDEQQQWEQLAEQVEADKAALSAQLQALQSAGARQPAAVASGLRQAARKAAGSIELDKAPTVPRHPPWPAKFIVAGQEASALLEALCQQPGVQLAKPEHNGWEVFHKLLRSGAIPARLCTDAHLAALAIANGWRLVSFDRDVERFAGLERSLLP